ncbi:PREDICTED: uncharacterized protein LOC108561405 [Nicrophorus vespilloides]|uniref:Uncharacterized protein LOC108561405 n=1 Tax=Nicrophorus vespilloides TaxID=110193 RepID=A0ABM1MJQ9_NICVS|nr:PREDICTED: uncharacterized protein LOC108561405 [Nicrophorus vespilloides]
MKINNNKICLPSNNNQQTARMETLKKIKVLNHPAESPWTSTAPLQSVTSTSKQLECEESSSIKEDETVQMDDVKEEGEKLKSINENQETNASGAPPDNRSYIRHSSSQFFHFVRLMQLFPNVHPATLHTVMTLCKNDFFIAVDKLLYAKKCKELYQNRRNLFQGYPKHQRYSPYMCNTPYCQNVSCAGKPQVIKLDAKRMISRNRCVPKIAADEGASTSNCSDLPPVSLQCNVPIRPLSPVSGDISDPKESPENLENIS